MGTTYLFECKKCGYRATVAGGFAEGYDLKIRTIFCKDCRSIYDCVIALKTVSVPRWGQPLRRPVPNAAPDVQSALARLPFPPRRAWQWREFDPACPKDPTHRIDLWTAPGRCPRCKAHLERGPIPFRIWE